MDDIKLKHSKCEELRDFSKELYMTSPWHLTQGWKRCVDNEGDVVEK